MTAITLSLRPPSDEEPNWDVAEAIATADLAFIDEHALPLRADLKNMII